METDKETGKTSAVKYIEFPRRQGKRIMQDVLLVDLIKKAKNGDKIYMPQIKGQNIILTITHEDAA